MNPQDFDKASVHELVMLIADTINDLPYFTVGNQHHEITACYPHVTADRLPIILDDRRFYIDIIPDGPA